MALKKKHAKALAHEGRTAEDSTRPAREQARGKQGENGNGRRRGEKVCAAAW
jgi:hypothetical protein